MIRFWTARIVMIAALVGLAAVGVAYAAPTGPDIDNDHPFTDCENDDFVDCAVCCAGKGADVRDSCIGAGFSEYYCEGLGQRVIDRCMAQACGLTNTDALTLFGTAVDGALRALAESPLSTVAPVDPADSY